LAHVSDPVQVYPNAKQDGAVVRVRNSRSGAWLGQRILLAVAIGSRLKGLLGKASLADGEGLWIEPCSSIHMFFMRFSIDVAFVDRDAVVVHLAANLSPWRIAAGGRRARAALELPSGTLARSETRVGDRLHVEPA
jgi:uncharacterized membrane protein (UPF0127 family)